MENIVTEKKKKCEICGKIKKKKCFIYNNLYKKLVCNQCNRNKGNNKWFVPKELRKSKSYNGRVSKYNFTEDEKKVLRKAGRSYKDINSSLKYLRNKKWIDKKKFWEEKKMIKDKVNKDSEQKRKLIEGLRNYNG